MTRKSLILLILAVFLLNPQPVCAEDTATPDIPDAFHVTKLPLPRFVSITTKEGYVRTGPGLRYPIKWIYKREGIPLEIILEYEVWRKIRDYDGQTGWIHQTLLSGKRTGVIMGKENINIFQKPRVDSRLAAKVQPGAIIDLDACITGWCKVKAGGYSGWAERKNIWGIYESEDFD
jgi:SH3-like domain-containing protein